MKLGERMKEYEMQSRTRLLRRTPVIIRIDGKAFHTFTKGLDKPFDRIFMIIMQNTMKYLCENIQGCVLGYTQSDEITLVLIDYQNLDSMAWFDNQVQKIVSVSSSLATLVFNKEVSGFVDELFKNLELNFESWTNEEYKKNADIIKRWQYKPFKATFDSRAFNLPKEEVCNNLIWRQQDATRNSINSLAQSLFSHKELQGVNSKDLQNKMLTEKDVNWNDLPTTFKRGSCCIKDESGHWIIDNEIPIFTENRAYIENLIYKGE